MSGDSDWQRFAAVLHPLPLPGFSALVLANATFGKRDRSNAATAALRGQGYATIAPSDVDFVYGKMETHLPQLLEHIDVDRFRNPCIEPAACRCAACDQDFDSHARNIPLHVYSSRRGLIDGSCVERHCSRCGLYFMGHWRYRRQGSNGVVTDMRMTHNPMDEDIFLSFSGPKAHSIVGMFVTDLRRASAVLHHARGSFTAVGEIMVEESRCPRMEAMQANSHLKDRVIIRLWVVFALAEFWTWRTTSDIDWAPWLAECRSAADAWLYTQKTEVRTRFVQKWLLEHIAECTACSKVFGFGLDGKRGMKRFVCACLQTPRQYVPFLDAWRSEPCPHIPRQGGMYCRAHDKEDDEEAVDPQTRITAHRRSDAGLLEFRVLQAGDVGLQRATWVPSEEVALGLARDYETRRLPERRLPGTGRRAKVRRTAGLVGSGGAVSSDVLAMTTGDAGPCLIDKESSGPPTSVAKWARRRMGGIIAAVSGCRIFMDWREHHGGEGTSEVYLLLGECIADIQATLT